LDNDYEKENRKIFHITFLISHFPFTRMNRWIFSIIAGVLLTLLLGVANNLALYAGYDRLNRLLFKTLSWSWPIFGAFFDIVAPSKHLSRFEPHPWGGYAALLLTVVLFSLISFVILGVTTRATGKLPDPGNDRDPSD
jgi:hypothetical protein